MASGAAAPSSQAPPPAGRTPAAVAQYRRGSVGDAHGLLERPPHLGRLAIAVPKRLEPRLQQGIFVVVLGPDAFDALLPLEIGQLDTFGDIRVADDRLGVAALRDGLEILEQPLADHHD